MENKDLTDIEKQIYAAKKAEAVAAQNHNNKELKQCKKALQSLN